MATARRQENTAAAALAVLLVAGVYTDGWAHVNVGGLDSFFTPWHAMLYGAFALLAGWVVAMVVRRRVSAPSWTEAVPIGYGWGLAGIAVFAVGGLGDMAWHLAFGVETGLDALVSPTHLLLLTGGVLLMASPLRAAVADPAATSWPAVISSAASATLTGFFLSYLSVFADPGGREPLLTVPEGMPGHRAGELAAAAGLGGYLVSTLVLIVPILFLRRCSRLPHGAVMTLTALLALPAAALSQFTFLVPAVTAIAGACVVELVLATRPNLSDSVLAGLLPGLVWGGQLAGLAAIGELRWPPALWSGGLVVTVLLSVALVQLPISRYRQKDERSPARDDDQLYAHRSR